MRPATRLMVDYFDGHSAQAHRVSMWVDGPMLILSSVELFKQIPLNHVRWSERTRHGARQAHLEDGSTLQAVDARLWDLWCAAQQLDEPLVVRLQQSWRWTTLATVLLLLVAACGYWWGLPVAAKALTPLVPESVDRGIGRNTLQSLDGAMLRPSKLAPDIPQQWQQRLQQAVQQGRFAQQYPELAQTTVTLRFRDAGLGPNALALPDGTIVVTDDLVRLLSDRDDVMLGVLGHELGHIARRHGLRTLIQTSLLTIASSVALGDFSSLLATAPALLGQLAYSRDMEREADDTAIDFMRSQNVRPSVMAVFFERAAAHAANAEPGRPHRDTASAYLPIAFSSHPANEERMARFRAADIDQPLQP